MFKVGDEADDVAFVVWVERGEFGEDGDFFLACFVHCLLASNDFDGYFMCFRSEAFPIRADVFGADYFAEHALAQIGKDMVSPIRTNALAENDAVVAFRVVPVVCETVVGWLGV